MNKPLFNVIIPVYNAEKYVSNAIESVSYLALYDGDINRTMMAYNLGKSGAEKAWNAGTRSTAYTDKVWSAMVGLLEEERDVS